MKKSSILFISASAAFTTVGLLAKGTPGILFGIAAVLMAAAALVQAFSERKLKTK